MAKIVIFGASQFAEMIRFYLTNDSDHTVVAHTVDGDHMTGTVSQGLPIVPFDEIENIFSPDEHSMMIAIGAHKGNSLRAEKYESARTKGYHLINFVHSDASICSDLKVGENTIIDQFTMVHPGVRIGNNVIIISSRIGHHSSIDNHCMISAATLGGGVNVGEYSFVGMNATVREQISIGRRCVVGAGALVLKNTKDDEVFRVRGTQPSKIPSRRIKIM